MFTVTALGLLSAVGDLRASSNASSVTISWTAPFSLDVTGVDPDIWYSVLIYNVTDENNPTAILCTDCINITETHYTFTPDYLSPCHVYNFSVIPVNGAGQGESSPHVSGYVLNCKYSLLVGICETFFVFFPHIPVVVELHIEAVLEDVYRATFNIVVSGELLYFCVWKIKETVFYTIYTIGRPCQWLQL